MKLTIDVTQKEIDIGNKEISVVTVTLPVKHCGSNVWLINHVPHAYSSYEETLQSYWCPGITEDKAIT